MLGVRLDSVTEKRLENLCQQTGRSKSYYTKQALSEFLDEREDYLLAISRLEMDEPVLDHNDFWKTLENEMER